MELPTSEEEVWRYSPIDDLELDSYALVPADVEPASVPEAARAVVRQSLAVAGAVVVVDGRIAHVELADQWASRGVTLGAAADHPDGADILGSVTGAEGAATPDRLGVLNDAFSTQPVVLDVPAGVTVDAPFVVVDWSATAGAVTFPHLVVRLGADAEATVVDHHGGDDVAALDGSRDRAGGRAGGPVALPQRAAARAADVADRDAVVVGRARRHARRRPGRARRRLRPHSGRLPAGRTRGHRQPDGRLLRRRRPDARLPHLPGPRRARTPPRTCCSRARSGVDPARSTPGSSGCGPRVAAPTPSRPTARSS